MSHGVHGIHHVTAVTATIGENLEFYTGVLGLRLVKKSVNQDDVSAYHLFYADRVGSPGTDMTFFDWPSSPANKPGAGNVGLTTFRAPAGTLDAWEIRLKSAGLHTERDTDLQGRDRILFTDPEGQSLALVDETGLPGTVEPWSAVVPEAETLRGIFSVDIPSARPERTAQVLTNLLGFTATNEPGLFEVRTESSVGQVRVIDAPITSMGRVGAGGVHHVAFRARDEQHLIELKDRIEGAGYRTSGEVDRYWFRSVYFREPGGVLFELATDGPGFSVDEATETLGEHLTLAPFLEPHRAEIEANLKPLPVPAYLANR